MTKVTYKAGPEDGKTVSMGGYSFEDGKAVEVKDESLLKKLAQNPWFTVAGEKAPADRTDDREAATPYAPSLANTTYPDQAPGSGMKTTPPPEAPEPPRDEEPPKPAKKTSGR